MRYFLLILMFIMASCQNTRINQPGVIDYSGLLNKRDLSICRAIAKTYAPDATIYIMPEQPLSYGILGLANQVAPHTYTIQIHYNTIIELETLFHEMGHVIDSEEGKLNFRGDMSWEGEKCDWEIQWMNRPWEISANQWRDCLRYEYQTGRLKNYAYAWELLPKYLNTYKGNSQYQRDSCLQIDTLTHEEVCQDSKCH